MFFRFLDEFSLLRRGGEVTGFPSHPDVLHASFGQTRLAFG
jgi:hypothetical protein